MKTADLISVYLNCYGELTAKQLSDLLGFSLSLINRNLLKLRHENKIVISSNRGNPCKPIYVYSLFEPKHCELMSLFYQKEFDHERRGLQG